MTKELKFQVIFSTEKISNVTIKCSYKGENASKPFRDMMHLLKSIKYT